MRGGTRAPCLAHTGDHEEAGGEEEQGGDQRQHLIGTGRRRIPGQPSNTEGPRRDLADGERPCHTPRVMRPGSGPGRRRHDAGTCRRHFVPVLLSFPPSGRVAQWESARLTRERSQVQNLPRPPAVHEGPSVGSPDTRTRSGYPPAGQSLWAVPQVVSPVRPSEEMAQLAAGNDLPLVKRFRTWLLRSSSQRWPFWWSRSPGEPSWTRVRSSPTTPRHLGLALGAAQPDPALATTLHLPRPIL